MKILKHIVLILKIQLKTLGCALSPNTASILIFRLLSGCFGAAPLVVSGAVIADLWDPKSKYNHQAYWF